MDADRFIARFPLLFHMAHDGSWPSIQRRGLLSTSALLDLFEIHGPARDRIESEWRNETIEIRHPAHGRAFIRDQLPLRPVPLRRCLTPGTTASDWYRILNAHVFFWVDRPHLDALVAARAYRDYPQTILTLDTGRLLARHLPEVRLSSINSGSIIRGGAMRGPGTFLPVSAVSGSRVVELCVLSAVRDVADVVLFVERREPDGTRNVLYHDALSDTAHRTGK